MGCLLLLLLVVVATNSMLTQARPSSTLLEEIRELMRDVKQKQSAGPGCGMNKYDNSETGISTINVLPKRETELQSKNDRGSLLHVLREYLEMDDRIFGGADVKRGEFPWMVALYPGNTRCGGSIISKTMILTAAHCVLKGNGCDKWDPSEITVVTQEYNRFKADGEKNFTVKAIFTHPGLNCTTLNLDYAILELNKPITYNDDARKICVPPYGSPIPYGATCIAAGWGLNPAGDTGVLKWIRLTIINQQLCVNLERALGRQQPISKFCTISVATVGDVCGGDSGGPLMCKAADGRYYAYGVVSSGPPCWLVLTPGLFANVPEVRNWIWATAEGLT